MGKKQLGVSALAASLTTIARIGGLRALERSEDRNPVRKDPAKSKPHQGAKERARRIRQMKGGE